MCARLSAVVGHDSSALYLLLQANGCPEGSYNIKSAAQLAYEQQLLRSVAPQPAPQLSHQQWLQQHKQRPAVPSGRSNSGSSTYSSEAADPAVLDPSALFRTSAQLQRQAQPSLSRDPSCQSNELGALLDSNIITEQQLQQQLRQQPGQHSLAFHQPALVPLMLPAQLSGDLPLDPQQQQLLRQLSNSTQHSQHSQLGGQGGASTSDHTGSPEGDDAQHARTGAGAGGGFNTSPANSSQTPAAADEEHGAESGKYSLPVANLKVACGDMVGTLMVHKARIRIYEGTEREKEVSPTEFERLGGRSATKKWKQSIRLIGEDGETPAAGGRGACRGAWGGRAGSQSVGWVLPFVSMCCAAGKSH